VLNRMQGVKSDSRSVSQISILKKEPSGLGMLPEDLFVRFLCLERKRTERSGRRFVLLLVDPGRLLKSAKSPGLNNLVSAIVQSTRDTDLVGWYKQGEVIGAIFTEVGSAEDKVVVQTLSSKLTDSLYGVLSIEEINEIKLSFHVFPEDWDDDDRNGPVRSSLHVALARQVIQKRASLGLKRLMDIVGSILGIILSLPVFVAIGLAIKLTSKGPIFFRQTRLGQCGKKFTFLKFRSMHANNDHRIHEEFVKELIRGAAGIEQTDAKDQKLYKLTADPRITPVGRFLRNTSLDELPQFLNVLWGDMSLVGPRPPVIYEFNSYDLWHKQRLLAVKPGITGLWQVDGRSRVKFDDMVRLDIRYARSWSLWLDISILLRTPRAVLSRTGAC
jgi:lipopolysaccharide/colanic/teichoic acid biosynthesis glycosyltransferase